MSVEPEQVTVREHAIAAADACLLVYSVSDAASVVHMVQLMHEVRAVKPRSSFPVIVVGNKSDCRTTGPAPADTMEYNIDDLVWQLWKCPLIETSAKDTINVHKTFLMLMTSAGLFPDIPISVCREISLYM